MRFAFCVTLQLVFLFLQLCHLLNKNFCEISKGLRNCLQYFRLFIFSMISNGTLVGRHWSKEPFMVHKGPVN